MDEGSFPSRPSFGEVERHFARARRVPPVERDAWLEAHCPDAELRAEVAALLEHDAAATSFLETPAVGEGPDAARWVERLTRDAGPAPEQIGPYSILEPLARGGMGAVYVAEQRDPKRRVALKLLHFGLADPRGRARFQREAAILARLEHPGIARIFEAGLWHPGPQATDGEQAGVPWFAMELIEGALPITRYAIERDLTLRARIALFADAADALHFGHLRGVVHRDLKPANVLVDRSGHPRVIDFGVARTSDPDLSAETFATRSGEWVGTLRYMSPEQCEGDPDAIDVRSDVYSLGVLLFELLSGRVPYELPSTSLAAAALALRESDVPRPSRIDPRLAGDLETILLRTLAREPGERYASAGDLARDLRHFLAHEPIEARPPTPLYLFTKWVRRRRATALAASALVLGSALAGLGLWRARAAAAEALLAKGREADERVEAERQREGAEAVTRFLERTLRQASPFEKGGDTTLGDVLEAATQELEGTFPGEPLLEARLAHTLGVAWATLGREEEAQLLLGRALRVREELLGEEHTDTAQTRFEYATNQMHRGASDARVHFERAIEDLTPSRSNHARELLVATTRLARLDFEDHRLADGYARLAEAKGLLEEYFKGDAEATESVDFLEARLRAASGNCDEAARLGERVVSSIRARGGSRVALAQALSEWAVSLSCAGHYEAADAAVREALEHLEAQVGRETDLYLTALQVLAQVLEASGEVEDALHVAADALDLRASLQPSGHPDRVYGQFFYARQLCRARRWEDADAAYGTALEGHAELHGDPIDETALMHGERGNVRRLLGRFAEAEEDLLEAERIYTAVTTPEDPRIQTNRGQLVRLYQAWARPGEAELWEARLANRAPSGGSR